MPDGEAMGEPAGAGSTMTTQALASGARGAMAVSAIPASAMPVRSPAWRGRGGARGGFGGLAMPGGAGLRRIAGMTGAAYGGVPFGAQGGVGFLPPVMGQAGPMDMVQGAAARRGGAPAEAAAGGASGGQGTGMTLVGELIVDGRQLGTVVAREQTRQAMLPSTRGSGIDVGSMPLYRSNSSVF